MDLEGQDGQAAVENCTMSLCICLGVTAAGTGLKSFADVEG